MSLSMTSLIVNTSNFDEVYRELSNQRNHVNSNLVRIKRQLKETTLTNDIVLVTQSEIERHFRDYVNGFNNRVEAVKCFDLKNAENQLKKTLTYSSILDLISVEIYEASDADVSRKAVKGNCVYVESYGCNSDVPLIVKVRFKDLSTTEGLSASCELMTKVLERLDTTLNELDGLEHTIKMCGLVTKTIETISLN